MEGKHIKEYFEEEYEEKLHEQKYSKKVCEENLYTNSVDGIKGMPNGKPLSKLNRKGLLNVKKAKLKDRVFHDVDSKWGWKEELLLLECVEMCGFFNWEKIARILSEKSSMYGKYLKFEEKEVQNHFVQYYLNGTLGKVWDYELVEKPFSCFDHTEADPLDEYATSKYLPLVAAQDLQSIKFLPHREEFEVYPSDPSETMVTSVDFSNFYMNNLKNLNMEQEVKELQLAVVDSYRMKVAERVELRKFMKDYKLIEQFFLSRKNNFHSRKLQKCELEKVFKGMQKFVHFFDTPKEFLDFYYDCVKEKLLKLEIARLLLSLKERKHKERNPEMKILFEKRAPSFLTAGLLLKSYKGVILQRTKRKKRKSKFTRKKRSKE